MKTEYYLDIKKGRKTDPYKTSLRGWRIKRFTKNY
jgi:hypothetical protein